MKYEISDASNISVESELNEVVLKSESRSFGTQLNYIQKFDGAEVNVENKIFNSIQSQMMLNRFRAKFETNIKATYNLGARTEQFKNLLCCYFSKNLVNVHQIFYIQQLMITKMEENSIY
jgi:hypothetical protein